MLFFHEVDRELLMDVNRPDAFFDTFGSMTEGRRRLMSPAFICYNVGRQFKGRVAYRSRDMEARGEVKPDEICPLIDF